MSPGRRPQANKASSWIREARERSVVVKTCFKSNIKLFSKQQRYSLSTDDGLLVWHISRVSGFGSRPFGDFCLAQEFDTDRAGTVTGTVQPVGNPSDLLQGDQRTTAVHDFLKLQPAPFN